MHFTVFIFCFYFVCAVPLKLSGLRHVNLDIYNNNNNNNNNEGANILKIPGADTNASALQSCCV